MVRYLHTLVRYWWLFLACVLVVTGLQIATIRPNSIYTARAVLLPEYSIYQDTTESRTLEVVQSTSENHTLILNSLVKSPAFLENVVKKSEEAGIKISPEVRLTWMGTIATNLQITTMKNNLIKLEFKHSDSSVAVITLDSFIKAYNEFLTNLLTQRGTTLIQQNEARVQQAKAEMEKSDRALKEFLAGLNVEQNAQIARGNELTEEALTFQTLFNNNQALQNNYDSLKSNLEKLKISYSSGMSGENSVLKIADEAGVADTLIYTSTFKQLIGLGVGLVGGIILAIVLVIVMTWADGSIRDKEYARNILKARYIGYIPRMGKSRRPLKEIFNNVHRLER